MSDADRLRNSADFERLRQEVKAAWDKLSADEKAALEPKMRAAYDDFLAARIAPGGAPRSRRQLVALYNVLHGNLEGDQPGPIDKGAGDKT
jgi:hypothetical protein